MSIRVISVSIKDQLGSVVEKWKARFYNPTNIGYISNIKPSGWKLAGQSNSWDSEEIYEKLLSLPSGVTLDNVLSILGVDDTINTFSVLRCSSCSTVVECAVSFPYEDEEYGECEFLICETCLATAQQVWNDTEGRSV